MSIYTILFLSGANSTCHNQYTETKQLETMKRNEIVINMVTKVWNRENWVNLAKKGINCRNPVLKVSANNEGSETPVSNINNLLLSLQVPSWVTQLYMIAVFTAVSCRVLAAAVLQYRLIFCQPASTSLYFILQPRYLRLFEHQKSQIDLKIIQQVLYLTLKVIKCKKSTKIWQEDES